MDNYEIRKVYDFDTKAQKNVLNLLQNSGIDRDCNLDYTCAIYDDENIIATGSCYGNTLRCLAVSRNYQGEGLMNKVISHLLNYQYERGYFHIFLYTKIESSKIFSDLGFYEIARVDNKLVFMENKKNGFSNYLKSLKCEMNVENSSAIVMNANPFTKGHLYLIEQAAYNSKLLHLFILSEDVSLFPFETRKKLIINGTSHLKNICYHDSGAYMISNSTFPSYFLKDRDSVIKSHALLDIIIFEEIAEYLNIKNRYVGHEPTSYVTNLYNAIMKEELKKVDINCEIIERLSIDGEIISASTVRKAIQDDDYELLKKFLPSSTFDFIVSKDAEEIVKKIKKEDSVIHY